MLCSQCFKQEVTWQYRGFPIGKGSRTKNPTKTHMPKCLWWGSLDKWFPNFLTTNLISKKFLNMHPQYMYIYNLYTCTTYYVHYKTYTKLRSKKGWAKDELNTYSTKYIFFPHSNGLSCIPLGMHAPHVGEHWLRLSKRWMSSFWNVLNFRTWNMISPKVAKNTIKLFLKQITLVDHTALICLLYNYWKGWWELYFKAKKIHFVCNILLFLTGILFVTFHQKLLRLLLEVQGGDKGKLAAFNTAKYYFTRDYIVSSFQLGNPFRHITNTTWN